MPLQHLQQVIIWLNNLIYRVFAAPQGGAFYWRIIVIVFKSLLTLTSNFLSWNFYPLIPFCFLEWNRIYWLLAAHALPCTIKCGQIHDLLGANNGDQQAGMKYPVAVTAGETATGHRIHITIYKGSLCISTGKATLVTGWWPSKATYYSFLTLTREQLNHEEFSLAFSVHLVHQTAGSHVCLPPLSTLDVSLWDPRLHPPSAIFCTFWLSRLLLSQKAPSSRLLMMSNALHLETSFCPPRPCREPTGHHQGAAPRHTPYLEAAGELGTHRCILRQFPFRSVETRFATQPVHICFQVIILQWNIQKNQNKEQRNKHMTTKKATLKKIERCYVDGSSQTWNRVSSPPNYRASLCEGWFNEPCCIFKTKIKKIYNFPQHLYQYVSAFIINK